MLCHKQAKRDVKRLKLSKTQHDVVESVIWFLNFEFYPELQMGTRGAATKLHKSDDSENHNVNETCLQSNGK